MIGAKYIPFVLKQVWRHRTRSLLTIAGVAIAMFLFIAVQTLQRGVHEATSVTAGDTTLVVYRENRFCPATSRLPEYYGPRIRQIPGVREVTPIQIVVNNCGASLDVVTFRGIPSDDVRGLASRWNIIGGSIDDWLKRSDAAILGERLAQRRSLKVGQSFDAAGVTVTVTGIMRSTEAQDQNVAYVHLGFLQRSAGAKGGVGTVTQFDVRVSDPARLEEVARAIDEALRSEPEPTQTRPEKAFVAQAGSDVVEIVGFTRYLGWGCLAAVLALVANAVVLSVQDRIREHAVLQTLGYRGALIARLIIAESILVGLVGWALGTVVAMAVVHFGRFTLSNEGLSVNISGDWRVAVSGLVLSAGVGVVAGLVPAWRAGRREIAQCFRAV